MKVRSYTKSDLIAMLKNFLLVVLGTLILALGCAIFVVPFDLVTGGATGLSIVIDNILGGLVPIDIIIAVLTWGLFFLGLIFLGRDFAIKTLVSTIIYPVAISVFMRLVSPDVLGGFFYLQSSVHSDIALIIGSLFGGVCIGTGCALTFLGGGSTGGIDIIAFILCKFFKRWKSSVVIFLIDGITVLLGMFVIGDLVLTLLGIISAFIGAMVIDRIFLGRTQAFTAEIISDRYEEIVAVIRDNVRRTSTVIDVVGAYSGEKKKMVMVTFTMRQYAELITAVNRIDKKAFVTISRAHEINGEGWTYGEHD
ncbi:MAG: YitT family protein [Clostridia bacterium]|nr:YitT family protein [Clostridia bacterium]